MWKQTSIYIGKLIVLSAASIIVHGLILDGVTREYEKGLENNRKSINIIDKAS